MYLSEQGGLSKLYRYSRPAQILRTERRFYRKTHYFFWFRTHYRSVLRVQLKSKDKRVWKGRTASVTSLNSHPYEPEHKLLQLM